MTYAKALLLVSLALLGYVVSGQDASGNDDADSCEVPAQTEAGWVCGRKLLAVNGAPYASFRGVPYGRQPLGELRFQELQPVEPWDGVRNATVEGPVCPYHDIYYGPLVDRNGVSEACIFANVHVPAKALPRPGARTSTKTLPILVLIHGGGWVCGSGDADFHGPEYLVGQDIIVVTFNYRLDMFGFLSLNTTKVPGNNGLRDAVTLLNWVQRNAQFFGGNPDEVTLAGHSAGSSNAHLLSLSPVTKGLFKRLWLMSGTAIPSYYSTSPAFTQLVTTTFLTILGLNGTDLDTVHNQLVQMPLEVLSNASGTVLDQLGVTSFVPVVESPLPNVTAIFTEDPEKLIADGVGNEIPIIVGFTSDECEANRPRLREINAVERYKENPIQAVPPHWTFTLPLNVTAVIAEKIGERYFGEDPTMDDFVNVCTDTFFTYPAIKLAQFRAESGGAPIYLYKLSYEAKYSMFKAAFNLTFSGAAHGEDLNRVLKFNTFPVPAFREDLKMSSWMSNIVANFVKTGVPLPRHKTLWPPQSSLPLRYQEFAVPGVYKYRNLTSEEQDMVQFFDGLRDA